jgi:hypothetical protein
MPLLSSPTAFSDKYIYKYTSRRGNETKVLQVDNIITCAGQESLRELQDPLSKAGMSVFRIGGSELASELDAKRAIDQGTRLAAAFENAKAGDVYSAPISWETKLLQKFGLMK